MALLAALFAKLAFMVPAHAGQPTVHAAKPTAKSARIHIAEDGWGATPLDDLQTVLDAVASELGSHFPRRDPGAIAVVAAGSNPMVLYDRGHDGEYVIQLSARDGRWYQFVYQFGHELCHIYSNYDNKPKVNGQVASHNQWFEESLCETAALYSLRKLAATWESNPAAGKWADYAPVLRQYADLLMNQPHRQLPPGHRLDAWFKENHPALQADPYLRKMDELVATQLLPLFERNPDNWGAIAHLNASPDDATLSFEDYLDAWCLACPEKQHQEFVDAIIALFSPPESGAPEAASPARIASASR